MEDSQEYFKELDLGFIPRKENSDALLYATEHATHLIFYVEPKPNTLIELDPLFATSNCVRAVFSFKFNSTMKLGFPDSEHLAEHPLYEMGLRSCGLYVLTGHEDIHTPDQYIAQFFSREPEYDSRHYIFTFSDNTFEVDAHSFQYTLETRSLKELVTELAEKE